MAILSWQEDYRVGDATIDSQHQYLFSLANDLVGASSDKAELTRNAMQLFRYVREHFDHEEAVMRQTGYPGYQGHVALHERLISQLSVISSDIAGDRWSEAGLRQFMNEWLVGHIVEQDTKLGRYIQQDPRPPGTESRSSAG
jgi:hemerythrin